MTGPRGVLVSSAVAIAIVASSGSAAHADVAGQSQRATYEPCAQLTWDYIAAGEPRAADTISIDIERALALVADRSGLDFVRAAAGTQPDLVFD